MYIRKCFIEIQLLTEIICMCRIGRSEKDVSIRQGKSGCSIIIGSRECIHFITYFVRVLAFQLFCLIFRIFILKRSCILQPVGKFECQTSKCSVTEITVLSLVHLYFIQRSNIQIVQSVVMQQIQIVQAITLLFCIGVIRTVTIYQPVVRHISISW